jgi:hypothetical protein
MVKRTTKEARALWEKVLVEVGLSMDAGRDKGHRKLVYVGDSATLEAVAGRIATSVGRVRPKGHGPDSDE